MGVTWEIFEKIKEKYRMLGNTGVRITPIALGGWMTYGADIQEVEKVKAITKVAYEGGINFFDNADMYGDCEIVMGKALADFPRNDLILSSKVRHWIVWPEINNKGLSRKHIMESIDRSLQRMGTDYLDLYFCHAPDEDTPLEETVRAMHDLVVSGKIIYWATSNFSGPLLRKIHRICDDANYYKPVVDQPPYNLVNRAKMEGDVGPSAAELGMGVTSYSPLAGGLLTGKYNDGIDEGSRFDKHEFFRKHFINDTNIQRCRELAKIADELGVTSAQLSLAWLLKQPNLTCVITGASRPEQVESNLQALQVPLDDEMDERIKQLFPIEQ